MGTALQQRGCKSGNKKVIGGFPNYKVESSLGKQRLSCAIFPKQFKNLASAHRLFLPHNLDLHDDVSSKKTSEDIFVVRDRNLIFICGARKYNFLCFSRGKFLRQCCQPILLFAPNEQKVTVFNNFTSAHCVLDSCRQFKN